MLIQKMWTFAGSDLVIQLLNLFVFKSISWKFSSNCFFQWNVGFDLERAQTSEHCFSDRWNVKCDMQQMTHDRGYVTSDMCYMTKYIFSSHFISLGMPKLGAKFLVLWIFYGLWHAICNTFGFLNTSKNLKNATLQRSLAFQMSMLDRLEKVNLNKYLCFGPTLKIGYPVEICLLFLSCPEQL